MTDLERSIHAQVTHMGSYGRGAMLRVASGRRVNKQTLASLENRGWLTHDDYDYDSIRLTPEGLTALRIIHEEYT